MSRAPTDTPARDRAVDLALLLQRVASGALLWAFHVRPKLERFDEELATFPDPFGIGHPASFALALLSEGLCSVAVAIGIATRLSALAIVLTMGTVLMLAARGLEGADVQSALLYALLYLLPIVAGPGHLSLDHRLRHRYGAIRRRVERRILAWIASEA
ncbi:DoxX family protein [Sandaracinus amylolyticus]|nr:DoxX family protein [Sandaracinus amylolyticus]